MNRIIIGNDKIVKDFLDDNVVINYTVNEKFLAVNNLDITFLADTNLEIYYEFLESMKLNINIKINDNVCANVFEKYIDGFLKIKSTYNLCKNSYINIRKFYDVSKIRQFDIINLNGENSKIDYVLKTISTEVEKYNLIVNHNESHTISNITNNAVNILNGEVFFDITGFVDKGKKGCTIEQNNRIVTFNEKKCQINPILLVDENDISASHSVFVGKFNDEEIFYLQSRGISYNNAIKLLVKGFLLSKLDLNEENSDEIEKIIQKYWR